MQKLVPLFDKSLCVTLVCLSEKGRTLLAVLKIDVPQAGIVYSWPLCLCDSQLDKSGYLCLHLMYIYSPLCVAYTGALLKQVNCSNYENLPLNVFHVYSSISTLHSQFYI
jgi:hypothetical protein